MLGLRAGQSQLRPRLPPGFGPREKQEEDEMIRPRGPRLSLVPCTSPDRSKLASGQRSAPSKPAVRLDLAATTVSGGRDQRFRRRAGLARGRACFLGRVEVQDVHGSEDVVAKTELALHGAAG